MAHVEDHPVSSAYRNFGERPRPGMPGNRQPSASSRCMPGDEAEAATKLNALNEAVRTPMLNRKLGLAYLSAADPKLGTRTWEEAMTAYTERPMKDSSQERSTRAFRSDAFDPIRSLVINETRPEDFFRVFTAPRHESALHYLRRLQNFTLDMGWLIVPVIPKRLWPPANPRDHRAITKEEHSRIIEAESNNPERQAYYEMLWLTGGAQSDIANLTRENVHDELRLLVYHRMKLRMDAPESRLRIGPSLEALLEKLPQSGPLFPTIRTSDASARAAEFWRRYTLLGIKGVSLHSYRYAWSERAAEAGYPERYAMAALGHGSKAVHRAYARKARPEIPSLEEYTCEAPREPKVVPFPSGESSAAADPVMNAAQEMLTANPELASAILALGSAMSSKSAQQNRRSV